jgi:choline dehydrogenase
MMGSHAIGVVDDELKVHGLEELRVIDAAVMPAVTSTVTNPRTIMIAGNNQECRPVRPAV